MGKDSGTQTGNEPVTPDNDTKKVISRLDKIPPAIKPRNRLSMSGSKN
jgi:hypothetical protein